MPVKGGPCEDTRMHHKEKLRTEPLLQGHLPEDESLKEYDKLLYPEYLYGYREVS